MVSLNIPEINILINKYNKLLHNSNNTYDIKIYKFRILNLKRQLDFKHKEKSLEYTLPHSRGSTNVKILCNTILNNLGFSQNTLYKMESERLCDKLCTELNWNKTHGYTYTNETLSICIVSEILDYYSAKYDESKLLDIADINIDTYIRLSLNCHNWCKKHYWKPKIIVC